MAKINYSAAELDQQMDTAVFGTDDVIGNNYSRLWRVSRLYLNRRDITVAGWYRIAQFSGSYYNGTIRLGGIYNSRRPTWAFLSLLTAISSGAWQVNSAKWAAEHVTSAGQSISKIRVASDGATLGVSPQYIDIYIPYAMTASSGQSYLYAFDCLGPTEFNVIPPTLVETEPTTSVEYTLANTTE